MMKPNVKAMLGKVGKPWAAKDSDGDKHINILDCQPYNPKKQGAIHDWMERRKLRKAGVEDKDIEKYQTKRKKEEVISQIQSRREEQGERMEIRKQARLSRYKKYQEGGGFWGQVVKGMAPPKKKPAVRVIYRKKGKGKKRKGTRVVYVEDDRREQLTNKRKPKNLSGIDREVGVNRPIFKF